MIELFVILLVVVPPVYFAVTGANEEMRERARFDRELAEIKRRTARQSELRRQEELRRAAGLPYIDPYPRPTKEP
jgi:hypothetical protein